LQRLNVEELWPAPPHLRTSRHPLHLRLLRSLLFNSAPSHFLTFEPPTAHPLLTELDILRDISKRLDALGTSYMLTGSMAMNYYAVPRMTRDLDIVIALPESMANPLAQALKPDYMIVEEAVLEAARTHFMFNAIHQEAVIKVDFVCRKDDAFHREEFLRKDRVAIEDFETWIVTAEDLILSKLVWMMDSGSEQQERDIRNLLIEPRDTAYLNRWAPVLGVQARLQKFSSP